MRPPAPPADPPPDLITDHATAPPARRLSRRRWLIIGAGLLCTPLVAQQALRIRRRLRGEPGPTGWFGHC